MSLLSKIKASQNIIEEAYLKNNGNIYISFSGGKDSTILRDIALRMYPNLKCVFSDTTNELKEVRDFVKNTPNVITIFPSMNFKQAIEKHGFPLVSKEVSQKTHDLKNSNAKKTRFLRFYGNNKGNSKISNKWIYLNEQQFNITNKCCDILKKNPLKKWEKENGNPKPIIALMSGESRLRSQLALYGSDSDKIYPFLTTDWTEEDIWEYSKRYNIRFAECYYDREEKGHFIAKRDRTGCEYCMFGIDQEKEDRFERSKILAPKKYEKIMNTCNNGISFKEAKDIVLNKPDMTLELSGGLVKDIEINEKLNKETYIYEIHTSDKECSCCEKKGKNVISKDINYITSFYDTPNNITNRKRVVECHYSWNVCNECGMSGLHNDLHLFDLNFNVTKRVIDYIYNNFDKKSGHEICDFLGIDLSLLFDIYNNYKNIFLNAKENHYKSIWFDKNNDVISV